MRTDDRRCSIAESSALRCSIADSSVLRCSIAKEKERCESEYLQCVQLLKHELATRAVAQAYRLLIMHIRAMQPAAQAYTDGTCSC